MIDHIAIKKAAGYNMVRPAEWDTLSREEQFELIKAKRVIFLCGERAIPTREALQWLAQDAAGGT